MSRSLMSLTQRVLQPVPKKKRHMYRLCDPKTIPEVSGPFSGNGVTNPPRVMMEDGICLAPYVSRISEDETVDRVDHKVGQLPRQIESSDSMAAFP